MLLDDISNSGGRRDDMQGPSGGIGPMGGNAQAGGGGGRGMALTLFPSLSMDACPIE